jgi:aspartyl/asparaginyl-tRNA synthetase
LGVAEKITSKKELLERMKEKGKDSKDQLKRYRDYIDLRNFGLPEHGGIGMGIERAVRYLLNIPHIRFTRPFPVMHGTKINH